jgi:hypothetical protein
MEVKRKEGERVFIVIRQGRIRDEARDKGAKSRKRNEGRKRRRDGKGKSRKGERVGNKR